MTTGETNSRSAMLSKPLAALSAGSNSSKSSSLGRSSSASRSRMALRYSVRVSRRNAGTSPGFGRAAAASSSCTFEIRRCGQILGTSRARTIGRHRLCAQLAHDLFPMLRRCGDCFDLGGLDDELCREIDGVMTIGAIAAEQVARGDRIVVVPAHPPRGAERHGREDQRDRRNTASWRVKLEALAAKG